MIPKDCKRLAEVDFPITEVTKVAQYYPSVDAMTKPIRVREDSPPYGGNA